MAKGEYTLFNNVPFQSVTAHPRRYGVMFNPSSSRSRLKIIDAGRRYGVRLRSDGVVEYSVDGDVTWQTISPLVDPCTQQPLPAFLSHDEQRAGQALSNVIFDMIAVGRGRVLAKEAGTDRVFHIVMDELFRTYQLTGDDCPSENVSELDEDPPVPGFYMKLDPEYFIEGPPSLVVPPEAKRSYANHPASLRLPVFSQLLELDIADVMLVLQRARTWYLIDTRSQLAIVGPEDLRFTEDDLKAVFTQAFIRDILDSIKKAAEEISDNWFTDLLISLMVNTNDIADDWRKKIEEEGFGVLVFPAYVALGVLLWGASNSKAVETETGGRLRIDLPALKNFFASPTTNEKAQGFINDALSKLFDGISQLRLRSRRGALQKYGERPDVQRVELPPEWTMENRMPTPNQPPAWIPSYVRTSYTQSKGSVLLSEQRYAIQFSKVLDMGVGYMHWSEQWLKHFGGEIHSLLATRPAFQQEHYNLIQYRFLNGPVIDGDGYNDGTTNFYLFVKLGPADSDGSQLRQRYVILYLDEQSYFTQRWRLVHPTDDILGDLFSLAHSLRDNPEWFNFSLSKYWSPFEGNLLNDDSRMAVRRQIIALTGFNQSTQRHEIFTIAYNFGVCDHTWRWRLFPSGEQVLMDSAIAQDRDSQLPAITRDGPASAYVVVNTLDLRDDTTLHVRGSMRRGATAPLRAGRWVQRYLPADCRHVPARHQLTGGKPASGFSHQWDFVSEAAYRRADLFYQFGVYEQRLDSRCQYYEVELLPEANGVVPRVEDVVGRVWSNDKDGAGEDRLRINTVNFVWSLPKENGAIIKRLSPLPDQELSPELITHEHRKRPSMSLYEPTTRFRLLERKPMGLIAIFYDKRDDDLQSVTDLPHPTTFRKDFVDANVPNDWKIEDGEDVSVPPDTTPGSIRVLVKANRRVLQPPNVRKAQIIIDKAPGLRRLHISFWTPQTEQEVCENIWKVSLAAIEQTGAVFQIFSVTRYPNFIRRAFPDAPLPFDFTGELGDAWRYDFQWDFAKEMEDKVRRYCTPDGHIEFGTSLWFEDVVGHRSLAQELVFG